MTTKVEKNALTFNPTQTNEGECRWQAESGTELLVHCDVTTNELKCTCAKTLKNVRRHEPAKQPFLHTQAHRQALQASTVKSMWREYGSWNTRLGEDNRADWFICQIFSVQFILADSNYCLVGVSSTSGLTVKPGLFVQVLHIFIRPRLLLCIFLSKDIFTPEFWYGATHQLSLTVC